MSNDSTFNQLLVKFGLDVLTGNKKSAQTAVESIVDVIGTGSAEGSGGIHREGGGVREPAGRPNPSKSSNRSWTRRGPFPFFRPGIYLKDVNAGTVKLSNSNITSRLAAAYPMKDRYAGTSVGRSTRLGPG